ncbi:Sorbosone dehydrogenase-domain-containing protein [Catenaria anguillulae PL171]|uniref:Sorbosone dehydrogenase-domain-containing protein n=1 Tax=Catenaria anguillulae PL171 TaxID=765915 RepID=A0A1Y2HL23_9FUNG|nr:Sorbosone dehydrogenase-domain-containing protein [Catenaria anguillulae PL171]
MVSVRSCIASMVVLLAVLAVLVQSQINVREPGFVIVPAWERLANPTGIRFAADGRVFVIGKGGVIYTAKNVEDRAIKVAADISNQVFNNFDKGLVGLAPHPRFPEVPHVYLLYNRDGEIGGAVPKYNDLCPLDQEILTDLQEIIVDWCSGSTTHAQGDLRFDGNGNLLMSVGDNTFFSNTLNFGENPPNLCPFGDRNDPESGGVMQCQSPASTSGKVSYIPVAELDAWQRGRPAPRLREHARGFRNPYRFVVDPANNGIILGDVGFGEWEEINYIPPVGSGQVNNYGWPCFEGTMTQQSVQARQFKRCEDLYRGRAVHTRAMFQYSHHEPKLGNAITKAGGASAVTGVAVLPASTTFPAAYRGAICHADYTRAGFWCAQRNSTGHDWDNSKMMVSGLDQIVDVTTGPDGALYLSQIWSGTVFRFNVASRERPIVKITPDVRGGAVPMAVKFSSAGTFDTTGGRLSYEWDLDGSGAFAGPKTPEATFTYTRAGPVTVSLRVRSSSAGNPTNVGTIQVYPGTALTGEIAVSVRDNAFKIGDLVTFSAAIRTETGAAVPAANLDWEVLISHCYPGTVCKPEAINCHQHLVNIYAGKAGDTLQAPDHEAPSWLTFNLRVRHPTVPGFVQEFTRTAQPNTIEAQVSTDPPGLDVIMNIFTYRSPAKLLNLDGGELSIEALSPQMIDRQGYRFASWSDGGAQSHTVRPVAGTVYTARYERFAIGRYAAGQGPAAPTEVSVAPGFRQCTVSWTPSNRQVDPANPITGFIVYHREIKFAEPTAPNFSSALVPATTTSYKITVDTGSRCEFEVVAVTRVGESSFKSPMTWALSSHLAPVGLEWCPDTAQKYRTVLVDDFSQGTSPRNMRGLLQEGEFLQRFDVNEQGKLVAIARTAETYWYSVMGTAAQCFDASQFTHLSFKVTAPPGSTLNVGMDSKDSQCAQFVPKKIVSVADWTAEKRFTGQEQTVRIPVAEISNNPQGVQSIFFNTMTVGTTYLFDDIFFLYQVGTGPNPPNPGECQTLTVDRFVNPDANSIGLWTGVEGINRRLAANVMYATATTADAYWASLLSGATCRDLSKHGAITFGIRPTAGNAYPSLQFQQRNQQCTQRDPEVSATVPLAQYVKDGVATVPLSAFTGVNLARAHALVLNNWPQNVEFAISQIDVTCSGGSDPQPPQPGCRPLNVDAFATPGANALGLWSGGEDATITYANNRASITPTGAGNYFASVLAGNQCRDISSYTALQFGIQVPAGGAAPRLHVEFRNAQCSARDPEVNARLDLAPFIKDGVATVPIAAIGGAAEGLDLKRAHALALTGMTAGRGAYVLSNMNFVCTGTDPTPPGPGTCQRLQTESFTTPEQNALGQYGWGEPSSALALANNALTLTSTATNGVYYASVLSTPQACRDVSPFSHLQFNLRGPAGGALSLEIQSVAATVASCQARGAAPLERRAVRVTPAGLNPTTPTIVRVPLSGFTGLVPTKVHAYSFGAFTAGTFVVDGVQLVSAACPAA